MRYSAARRLSVPLQGLPSLTPSACNSGHVCVRVHVNMRMCVCVRVPTQTLSFQESISEDPHLNGIYSAAFLQGFQGDDAKYLGVAATCKHLTAVSPPTPIAHLLHPPEHPILSVPQPSPSFLWVYPLIAVRMRFLSIS